MVLSSRRGAALIIAAAALTLVVVASAGCRKKAPPPPKPAATTPAPVVAPPPPPPPPVPGEKDLSDAMRALKNGDPVLASSKLEAVIAVGERAPGRIEALFTLALLEARPDNPARDVDRARALLEQVLASNPPAPKETEARLILYLLDLEREHEAAIQTLKEQLDAQRTESEILRTTLARREEEIRRIKEILLEKTPG